MFIPNYQGGANSGHVIYQDAQNTWIGVYNNTGAAISNGAIKELTFNIDVTDTSNPIVLPVMIAPATEATASVIIGVVDNSIIGQETIPDATWGWLKVRGVIDAQVDGTADLVAGDHLEVLNAGTYFIDSGGAAGDALADEDVAIVLEAYTTNSAALIPVHLIGRQVVVKGA